MQELSDLDITRLGILTGSIFLILILPLRFYLRGKALKRIKKTLKENEVIVYKAKISYFLDYFGAFLVGGFIGCYLIPFWLYPHLQTIGIVSRENIYLFILGEIIAILGILGVYSKNVVLTNLRILSLFAFPALDKMGRVWDIKYSDIDTIKLSETFFYPDFYIRTKDEKYTYLLAISNKREFKDKVEELSGKKF